MRAVAPLESLVQIRLARCQSDLRQVIFYVICQKIKKELVAKANQIYHYFLIGNNHQLD